jgi:serine/threonine-protein kinase
VTEGSVERLEERFVVAGEIGRGGTARVFLARDATTGERCALKVLLPRYAARADLRHRFHAEARAMSSIGHPNVLAVLAWGTSELGPWLVTEYAHGGSIAQWVRHHGPMPPALAADVVAQMCRGVAAAHAKGIVHRDLKPDNVLVMSDGTCKVADFGVAQVARAAERITVTGARIGTLGYVAPEQIEDARDADARADVYGISATLWMLVTGKVPAHAFHADPYQSGVPGPLCPIVARGTAYRREERFPTVAELGEAVEAALARLPPAPAGTPSIVGQAPVPGLASGFSLEPTSGSDGSDSTWVDDEKR